MVRYFIVIVAALSLPVFGFAQAPTSEPSKFNPTTLPPASVGFENLAVAKAAADKSGIMLLVPQYKYETRNTTFVVTKMVTEDKPKLAKDHQVVVFFVAPEPDGRIRLEIGKVMPYDFAKEQDGSAKKLRDADPGLWAMGTITMDSEGKRSSVWVKDSPIPNLVFLRLKGDRLWVDLYDREKSTPQEMKFIVLASTNMPELKGVSPDKFKVGKTFKPELGQKIFEFLNDAIKKMPKK